ncbi:MAG TPA: ABC transporter substrate-binding protein [Coriobacteriia bacterium]|jgi:osmoprotectant transport system substrate-binding protein
MRRSHILIATTLAAVALVFVGCAPARTGTPTTATPTNEATGQAGGGTKGPIKVGSKIDTEGSLLAQLIIAMLKNDGFNVVDRSQLGTTDVNRKALLNGEIDVYPEYTGTALTQFFAKDKLPLTLSKEATASYERVKELDAKENDVAWLGRAPADNTFAIAVPKKLADASKLMTLDDWAKYINGGGTVKLVASSEFVQRSDALPAFEKAYGFKLKPNQVVALSGGNTAVTEAAAANGQDGANAAMAYGTDGNLAALNLVILKDTKGVQPVYQPAPTFRGEIVKKYPEIPGILDPVFSSLTLETLQQLNAKISVDGQDPKKVATDYLTSKGFLK